MTVVFILGFCPQPLQDRDTVSGLLLAVLCAVLWYHLWLILLQAPWHLCPISYQTRRFLAVCASPPIFYQLLLLSRVQPWISLCWILFFPRWVILIFILFLGSCVYCCFPSLLPEVSLPNFSMIGKSGRIRRGTYSPPPHPLPLCQFNAPADQIGCSLWFRVLLYVWLTYNWARERF